ncbi:MAG: Cobalamin biosynthesis protein CbiB [Pseudomonadota bacterium]|jgi:adenosylcobinamide-phosphate synthase
MSFFSIFLALVIEQARPMSASHFLHRWLRTWADWVTTHIDGGTRSQAWLAWGLIVGVPAGLAILVHWLLAFFLGWFFAILWNVALLYVTLGFRQFSHHFTGIRDALNDGDEALARKLLADWQQVEVNDLPRNEIVRHVIEHSILSAHRHVFGVFFSYALLSVIGLGPVGAVVYRISEFAKRYSSSAASVASTSLPSDAQTLHWVSDSLKSVSNDAWHAIDWIPARATAMGFAIMGSFEDAMDGWRHHAEKFPDDNDGVILAATAGAINVQLGGAALQPDSQDSISTPGRSPELSHFAQVVGLVWRTVIMWLVLVALLSLANLLG